MATRGSYVHIKAYGKIWEGIPQKKGNLICWQGKLRPTTPLQPINTNRPSLICGMWHRWLTWWAWKYHHVLSQVPPHSPQMLWQRMMRWPLTRCPKQGVMRSLCRYWSNSPLQYPLWRMKTKQTFLTSSVMCISGNSEKNCLLTFQLCFKFFPYLYVLPIIQLISEWY